MSRCFLRFKTMQLIVGIPGDITLPGMMMVMAKAEEFSSIALRRHEKRLLNTINTSPSTHYRQVRWRW